ncbi:MAG TPA: hypothetical protein VLX90_04530 [Steroidobacteraceae bacterium]|nr:hypothetical protein [Steroidobacteraceae bacterium]
MSPESNPDKLERLVGNLLRDLPARRAPATLENRVLAQVALAGERSAAPWWRRSFVHWPAGARIGFLVASYGFIRLVLAGAVSAAAFLRLDSLGQGSYPALTWLRAGASLGGAAIDTLESLLRAIPTGWLYGAVIAAVTLYVTLFGLGTLAYRTLYAEE